MPLWIQDYLSAANPMFYPTFGISLFLAGLCMPISADVVLLTAGYLAYRGDAEYATLMPLAIFSILAGDSVMYSIGHRFGSRVMTSRYFRRAFTPTRIASAEAKFQRQGYRVVFLARFMPGVRTVFMFTSGTLGLRYSKFIAFDAAGALIVVPCTLLSVKWVAGNLEAVREKIALGQWIALIVLVVIGAFALMRRRRLASLSRSR